MPLFAPTCINELEVWSCPASKPASPAALKERDSSSLCPAGMLRPSSPTPFPVPQALFMEWRSHLAPILMLSIRKGINMILDGRFIDHP